jgi:hypothetical protein
LAGKLLLENCSGQFFTHSAMEVAMINGIVLEGIIIKTWKYAEDLLFR